MLVTTGSISWPGGPWTGKACARRRLAGTSPGEQAPFHQTKSTSQAPEHNVKIKHRASADTELGRTSEGSRQAELEERGAEVGFRCGMLSGKQEEQGKQLSKDSVSAGDYLRRAPRGAQSMACTCVVPLEAKGLCNPMTASHWPGVWGPR